MEHNIVHIQNHKNKSSLSYFIHPPRARDQPKHLKPPGFIWKKNETQETTKKALWNQQLRTLPRNFFMEVSENKIA